MVIELENDADLHINYIGAVIQQESVQEVLAPIWDGPAGFVRLIDCLRSETWRFFVPCNDDNKPMGLIWGEEWSPTEWLSNVVFLRKFWGKPAIEGALEVEKKVAKNYEQAVGLIHPKNLLSIRYANRLGFKQDGQIDMDGMTYNFFRRNIYG